MIGHLPKSFSLHLVATGILYSVTIPIDLMLQRHDTFVRKSTSSRCFHLVPLDQGNNAVKCLLRKKIQVTQAAGIEHPGYLLFSLSRYK
jgi:hypothetical protein